MVWCYYAETEKVRLQCIIGVTYIIKVVSFKTVRLTETGYVTQTLERTVFTATRNNSVFYTQNLFMFFVLFSEYRAIISRHSLY